MERAPKQLLARLGSDGLGRALDDLLDQSQLVHLANTCGLKYRGMRTQTQTRERLLADLVDKAGETAGARKAVLHALRKETAVASREWSSLEPAEKARRLADDALMRAEGNLGLHIFLLASSADPAELDGFGHQFAEQRLHQIARNGHGPAPAETASTREVTRLKRKITGLEKKNRHIDAQLVRSRDSQKAFKRDLIQRKGELAESRMLVERLRRELSAAETAVEIASAKHPSHSAADRRVTEMARAVKQLVSQQNKLAHALEKQPKPSNSGEQALVALVEQFQTLRQELAGQQGEQKKELTVQVRRLEELRAEVRSQVSVLGAAAKSAKRARARSEGQRVGVFIDVQNMYYAARQLKGKLDFDALMDAAVTRGRLIQATAYVVESKEIDQSQFIKMLQQRAITVRRKTLKVRADGSMKGDWDMELAFDILDAAPQLDVVVLVSGDGDFTSLVTRVKLMGPRVEVLAFPRATAKALVEAADRFQPLDRKFMIYPKRHKDQGRDSGSRTPPAARGGGKRSSPNPGKSGDGDPAPATPAPSKPV